MAGTKTTGLTELTTPDNAADWIPIVDVSDVSMAASGTDKKIKPSNLVNHIGAMTFGSLPPASSNTGKTASISNQGFKYVYSDGTDWRYVSNDLPAFGV